MAQIQGLAAHAAGPNFSPSATTRASSARSEVEIAITHCGICHSDLHLIANDWGISQYPFIPGHEIIGTVAASAPRSARLRSASASALAGNPTPAAIASGACSGQENLCAVL